MRFLFFFTLLLLGLAAPARGDDTATTSTLVGGALLRVGYLRPEGEADLTPRRMEALRRAFLADEGVRRAMETDGYAGIGLFPTDGGRDMRVRLDAVEFDVAFLPARLWAEQRGGYEVILQTRRARDFTATRGNLVLQRGVLFASPRSPLFAADAAIDREAIRRTLASSRLAVVSSQSLAGFVAPLLKLEREFGVVQPEGGLLWCESSSEVAKAVLAGLADVGVCEEGALDEVLREAGIEEHADDVRRVLLRSAPVPTDPVAVRPGLSPAKSALGRELKRALRSFSLAEGFGNVALQSAENADYAAVREMVAEFEERVGEVRRP